MQKGLDLVQLATKIQSNQKLKKDFIADTNVLTMQVRDKMPMLEIPNEGDFPLLPVAHDQIGARTGIPAKYYDRMLQEAPDLLATNVNAWFRKNPEKRMVRTLAGNTRAFLSNRYNRIENEEIAEVALPILQGIPDVQIVSSEVTERRMYIQAVSPRLAGEVKKGDVVQAGVVISNSETGQGALSVSPMFWRLICLNGMIGADNKFRAYHVGRAVEDNSELWRDDTRKADDRAVLLKFRDMVEAAVSAVQFKASIEKLNGFTKIEIKGNPAKAIEVLAQKIGANENERGGILNALIKGGDLSAWGIVNAVTAQAHTARSYDRAVEFETLGGSLIDLPRTEWQQVLEAA
jgi:hypothetical protein